MGCCGYKDAQIINQRTVVGADPGIIPEEITDALANSIVRIEYKMNTSIFYSTGFFIKKVKDKILHFLFTCEHSIEEKVIQSSTDIFLYFGKAKDEKVLEIRLDKNERFFKSYKDLDAIMIQILQKDNISEDKFLLPDYNYLNGISEYIDKQIYIGGYPIVKSHKKEKHFSSGVIKKIVQNNTRFLHSSDTRGGSSGSPIIDTNKKVVGIHNGAYQQLNLGTFIGPIINELTKEGNY